jgi:peptidoglycan/LPS O-acetylase OafA/YrhL
MTTYERVSLMILRIVSLYSINWLVFVMETQFKGYGLKVHNALQLEGSPVFRGNISPTSSGWKSKPSKKLAEAGGNLSLCWFLAGLHFDTGNWNENYYDSAFCLLLLASYFSLLLEPEDGGDMFLRNAEMFPNYKTVQTRRGYFSLPSPRDRQT